MHRVWTLGALAISCSIVGAAGFTVDDLLKVRRVGEFSVSPDGKQIVFELAQPDLDSNSSVQHLYIVPVAGGAPRQLTNGPRSESEPAWSPDSRAVAFVADRDGLPQVWEISASGGEARKITTLSTGASKPLYSPDGKWIAFVSSVYPDLATDAEQKARIDARAKEGPAARLIDHLLYRHWNEWEDGRRRHIMLVPADGGEARDLTPGENDQPAFADPSRGFVFSPESNEICFSRGASESPATSTNSDLWTVDVATAKAMRLTSNPAADDSPDYSRDGRFIAYRAQRRTGYESDRWELMLYDRSKRSTRSITESLDRWVDRFAFAGDSGTVYFTAEESGRRPLFCATSSGTVKKLADAVTADAPAAAGSEVVFVAQSFTQPPDLYAVTTAKKTSRRITSLNDALLAPFDLRPGESVTYPGAGGVPVQGWVVKPAASDDEGRKYPLLLLIHGGPQGAFLDSFSYRWNAQVFAQAGFVVFMPNPRGSVGFGQDFVDGVNGDWGGRPYIDIMAGVDYVAKQPQVDGGRAGAAGGSFGGYMVNWIAGRTDRFKVLVSHAGIFNTFSFYATTEELWFPEWEFGGTPWANADGYGSWSPHLHAGSFKTPMLLTQGELDYRVSASESQQLFTILQRRGIPSRLLWFPDEGHLIEKPKNARMWYETVISWLRTYLLES